MKKKIILLDSSYPLNSRNIRILENLDKNYDTLAVTWDRSGSNYDTSENIRVFNKKSAYGNKFLKILYLPKFYNFIKKNILDIEPDVLIASNWDMLIIGSLLKFKFKYILIYENRDMVSSKIGFIKCIIRILERLAMHNIDSMIIASRYFKNHYKWFRRDVITLENKVSENITIYKHIEYSKLRISFIGTVRFYNILKNMVDAIRENEKVEFHLYGDGPDRLRLEKYVYKNKIRNVNFHGSFMYKDIGKYYAQTDIIWSVYPNTTNSNKKYVIPNKYYESLYFNIPGIFPNNTNLGDLVLKQDVGFVVNPYSVYEINKCIMEIISRLDNLNDKVKNMQNYKNEIIFENDVTILDKLIRSK